MNDTTRHSFKLHFVPTCLCSLAMVAMPEPGTQAQPDPASRQPPAKRELGPQQLKEMLQLSDLLIDKRANSGKRETAAIRLGEQFGRKECIPALLAVLRDHHDQPGVRQRAVLSLSWIPDRRVIDYLIEALLDHEYNVAVQAHVQLQRLTGQRFEYERLAADPKSPMRERNYRKWRDWWESNREHATLNWNSARVFR